MSLDQSYEKLQIKTNSLITKDKIQEAKEFIYLSRLVLKDQGAKVFYHPEGQGARIEHRQEALLLESVIGATNNGYYDESYTRIGLIYPDMCMYYEIYDERVRHINAQEDTYLQFIMDSFRAHYEQYPLATIKG